jgi:hypothetical protein
MDRPSTDRIERSDQTAIDKVARSFFTAFSTETGLAARMDELRGLFSPAAIIAKRDGDSVEIMSVDAFIDPREALLSSGTLTDFSEWETSAETRIFNGLACRCSTYEKSGLLHGKPYAGGGRKVFSLVRSAGAWRIVSVTWEDDR